MHRGGLIMLSPSCADEGSRSKKPKCAFACDFRVRTAIDADGIAGDPPRVLRGEERHNRTDIIGLADPLERLHAENEGLALVGLDEVRHVGVDDDMSNFTKTDAEREVRSWVQALKRIAQPEDVGGAYCLSGIRAPGGSPAPPSTSMAARSSEVRRRKRTLAFCCATLHRHMRAIT